MRLHQLNEDMAPDLDELYGFIQDNCQPYLKANPDWKTHKLYRGVMDQEDIFVRNIRVDRKPKDTPIEMHNLADRYLQVSGLKATRSNSIFCTGGKEVYDYGLPYVIFPIGDFDFTWNPYIRDLTYAMDDPGFFFFEFKYDDPRTFKRSDLPNRVKNFFDNMADELKIEPLGDTFKIDELRPYEETRKISRSTLFYFLEHNAVEFSDRGRARLNKYTDKDLPAAIKSQNEIMISASKYVGIDTVLYSNWVRRIP